MRTPTRELKHFGIQRIYEFPNGYSASVILNPISMGNRVGLWELLCITPSGRELQPKGWLSERQVDVELNRIESLERP